jgi:hypothetical protein
MRSNGLSTSWNMASSTWTKSHFKTFRRQTFSGPIAYLKKHLHNFIQVTLLDAQNEKCLRMAFRNLSTTIHLFHQILFSRRLEDRLSVLRAIRLLKLSLKQLLSSRFFRFPECSNRVRMVFRHLQTSLHRHQQSRFLRRSEDRLWVLRFIRQLKISLPRLRPNRLFECPERRKCVEMVFRHHKTSIHRIQQNES